MAGCAPLDYPISAATPAQLQAWLEQFPDADADGDGVLTIEEARAYRQMLQRRQAAASTAVRHEYTSATMSDGVGIALAVSYPADFDPA